MWMYGYVVVVAVIKRCHGTVEEQVGDWLGGRVIDYSQQLNMRY